MPSTRSPIVIAITLATLGSGLLNLYSLIHPALPVRLAFLARFLPVEFVTLSRFMTLVVGFALVITAFNIYKRKRRALQAVVALSALSIAFHFLKGVDYEEASLSVVLIVLAIAGRSHFTVRSAPPAPGSQDNRIPADRRYFALPPDLRYLKNSEFGSSTSTSLRLRKLCL